jgi:hypothetical protein
MPTHPSLHRRLHRLFSSVNYAKLRTTPVDFDEIDEEEEEDGINEPTADENEESELELSGKLEQAIAALILANPALTKQEAAHYLLHSPHGRALAAHLSKQQKETTIMDRSVLLESIVKAHGGIQAMAKLFLAEGKPLGGVTEAEFTKLIDDEAQKQRQPGERPGSAFNRYFTDPANVELRKAHALTRGF